MIEEPYKKQSAHGKCITIRPVDGGFIVERYLKPEKVVTTFNEAITEIYKWCYEERKLGAECEVTVKLAEWAEGKA